MTLILDYAVAIQLWIAIIVYAALEGADFGGGILSIFASGPQKDDQQTLIKEAVGPVWEANNVWLTYLVVGLFAGFPLVAELLATALFIPLVLILIGIVLRGAAFIFQTYSSRAIVIKRTWQQTFSIASSVTPFLFGAAAAAVASGRLRVVNGQMPVGVVRAWLTPFAIVVGLMGIALCATLAAVYLTVEAQGHNRMDLAQSFRLRACIAGFIMAVLGLIGLILAPSEAPILWHGMLDHALWALALAILLGLATAGALFFQHYRQARVLMILDTGAILGTWGLAQLPYLVPPDVTVNSAASPPLTMTELFVCASVGMAILIPALWLLFHVFKGANVIPPAHEKEIEGI
jgi:cytochrome d ubiquinol oxidase subunit II